MLSAVLVVAFASVTLAESIVVAFSSAGLNLMDATVLCYQLFTNALHCNFPMHCSSHRPLMIVIDSSVLQCLFGQNGLRELQT